MNYSEKKYYDSYWSECWMYGQKINPVLKEKFIEHLKGSRLLLDLGCGDGKHYSKFISGLAKVLIGLDISVVALRSFMEESGGSGVAGDIKYNLPIKDSSFDHVVWIENVEHLIYPEIILKEVHRVLKKDGILIITTPNITYFTNRVLFTLGIFNPMGSPEASFKKPWNDPHIRFFTFGSLKRFLNENGFETIEVIGTNDRILFNLPIIGKVFKFDTILIPIYRIFWRLFPSFFSGHIIGIARRTDV